MQKSNTESVLAFADFAASAAGRGVLRLLVFSLPRDRAGAAKKVCGTLKKIGANTVLQLEYSLSEGRLRHENILLDGVADKCSALAVEYSRGEAYIGDKCASLMISKKGKATFELSKANTYLRSDVTADLNPLLPVKSMSGGNFSIDLFKMNEVTYNGY